MNRAKPKRRRLSPAEKARIAEIFRRFEAASPDPRTELAYKTPFTLLVSVVLSAQATDKSVNKATGRLYAVADTPQQMIALGEPGLTRRSELGQQRGGSYAANGTACGDRQGSQQVKRQELP